MVGASSLSHLIVGVHYLEHPSREVLLYEVIKNSRLNELVRYKAANVQLTFAHPILQ